MEPDRGTVFVTGAAGYVGRFLVRRLLGASLRVRCLALPDESIEPLAGLPVEIVRGDVTRLETFLEHGHGVGAIVHAAAAMLPNPPALVERVNVEGTRRRLWVHAPLWACHVAAHVLAPLLGPRSFLTPEALLGLNEDAARDHGELTRDFGFRPRTLESGLAQLFGERRRISPGP